MYSGKILMLLAISLLLIPLGVAQAETSTPYATASIVAGDNVVTLSPNAVPTVQVHRRYYRYRPYYYSYGYYPYSYYYGYPYYYSYRTYPSYRYYRPYAYGW